MTAFIYCNHNEQAKHTICELIASMLEQLVQDHPVISEQARSLYDKHYSKSTYPLLEELMEALWKEVDRYSRIFIIVNALDKLQEHHHIHLIQVIQSLSNTVNLMVTSCLLPLIETIFQEEKSIHISASAHDVWSYIQHCIQQEAQLTLLVGEREDLQQRIVDKISRNIQGMFVYSFYHDVLFVCIWHWHRFLLGKLHMDILALKNNPRAVCDTLDILPMEVEVAYHEAMHHITIQGKIIRTLQKASWFGSYMLTGCYPSGNCNTLSQLCLVWLTSILNHSCQIYCWLWYERALLSLMDIKVLST